VTAPLMDTVDALVRGREEDGSASVPPCVVAT